MEIRNSLNALKQGDVTYFSTDNILALKRTIVSGESLIIVNPGSNSTIFLTPDDLVHTSWKNMSDQSVFVLPKDLILSPHQYLILKKYYTNHT